MDNYNKLAEESTDDTDPIPQNESLVSNDNESNNDAESVENDGAKSTSTSMQSSRSSSIGQSAKRIKQTTLKSGFEP